MFQKAQLDLLKQFVSACRANPEILHTDEISFFKEWILSLGAQIPEPKPKASPVPDSEPTQATSTPDQTTPTQENTDDDMPDLEDVPDEEPKVQFPSEDEIEEEVESDLDIEELDGIINDEVDEPLDMGDNTVEVTEEMRDESNSKRSEAMCALGDGNFDEAIKALTEAIKKNPSAANLYAKRASALVKAKRPKAAICDCVKALEINKDSAQPYKWRGRAHRLLGRYEEAYHDFQMACRLDMDETTYEWQKEVEANAKKIMEHKRKYERIHKEKELERKRKEVKRRKEQAQKEYEKAKQEESRPGAGRGFPGGFPGGMGGMPGGMGGFPGGMGGMPGGMGGMPGGMGGMPGGMGGMPGGMGGMPGGMGGMPGGMPGGAAGGAGMPDLSSLFNDPELMTDMQDPEVMAAFQDVSKNPENINKYENNPKVKNVIEKLQKKFAGAPGGPGMPK